MRIYLGRLALLVAFAFAIGWVFFVYTGIWLGILSAITVMAAPVVISYYHLYKLHNLLLPADSKKVLFQIGSWTDTLTKIEATLKSAQAQVIALEAKHNRFIQGFQASPNAVVMLDERFQIEWCNSSAESFFGINFRRDQFQNINNLVRHIDLVNYLSVRQFEHPVMIDKLGYSGELTISVQVFPFGTDQLLLLAQDVTDLQKTEAMRRDFVANVSHEIRTPLTVMIGFLETMQSIELSADQRNRYLGLMMTQSTRMKSLVEDLLTLANLEVNTSFAPRQEFDVVAEMTALQIDAEALSAGRHQFIFDVSTDISLYGDQRELHSAFSNLISNAIRYTPEGGCITVKWGLSPSRHGIFSVTDTGPGIEAVHLSRLTERFYRVDGSRSRDTGGTGLGLAIVKHIATRHNAQLLISSVVGEGSTFKLRFASERLLQRSLH